MIATVMGRENGRVTECEGVGLIVLLQNGRVVITVRCAVPVHTVIQTFKAPEFRVKHDVLKTCCRTAEESAVLIKHW